MIRRASQKTSRSRVSRLNLNIGNETSRLDRHLFRMLSRLAILLLRHGYGFSRASHVARTAFVNAAQELDSRDGSKSSIARMATVTGLTRTEVSKLIRAQASLLSDVDTNFNRATRVANGWRRDRQFIDSNFKPRSLPFSSSRDSFSRLVRKYSGDIPPRAMLTEMVRLGMARRAPNDIIYLLRATPNIPKSAVDALRAISSWIAFLTESNDHRLTTTASQVRVFFKSIPQALAAIRELEDRQNSFREAIEQLGNRATAGSKYELKISIAMATERPSQISQRKRSKPKEY